MFSNACALRIRVCDILDAIASILLLSGTISALDNVLLIIDIDKDFSMCSSTLSLLFTVNAILVLAFFTSSPILNYEAHVTLFCIFLRIGAHDLSLLHETMYFISKSSKKHKYIIN